MSTMKTQENKMKYDSIDYIYIDGELMKNRIVRNYFFDYIILFSVGKGYAVENNEKHLFSQANQKSALIKSLKNQ